VFSKGSLSVLLCSPHHSFIAFVPSFRDIEVGQAMLLDVVRDSLYFRQAAEYVTFP